MSKYYDQPEDPKADNKTKFIQKRRIKDANTKAKV